MILIGYRKFIVVLVLAAMLTATTIVSFYALDGSFVAVAIAAIGAGLTAVGGLYFKKNVDAKNGRAFEFVSTDPSGEDGDNSSDEKGGG